MLLARYTNGPIKLCAGYEWIQFAPPSDPQTSFTDIAGDPLCLGCAAINNTNINNTAFSVHRRFLQIFWTGVKYAVTDNLDLTGAYYHYNQDSFAAVGFGGQRILVIPDLDLVVVITSDAQQQREDAQDLVGQTIIPAVTH